MAKESLKIKKERATKIVSKLKSRYPDAQCSLTYQTNFQLLIAVMLSAQTTDNAVNKATPKLFQRFGTPEKMAKAPLRELEKLIQTIGLFRNKAKNCQKTAKIICEKFNREVPEEMVELILLPGVGRKTANVVLGNAFGVPAMVVDTHVTRIAYRLGLTTEDHPEKIEKALEKVIPKKDWVVFTHLLIEFGREICKAPRAQCEICDLELLCPKRARPKKPKAKRT